MKVYPTLARAVRYSLVEVGPLCICREPDCRIRAYEGRYMGATFEVGEYSAVTWWLSNN